MALAAEIADGWLPMFFSPKADAFYREALADGFASTRRGTPRTTSRSHAWSRPSRKDDIEACADLVLRPNLALYIGGMGARDRNFHKDVFERLGYGAECEKIQDVPRRAQGRRRGGGAHPDGRGRLPGGAAREDPRRPRAGARRASRRCWSPGRSMLEQIADLVNG